LWHDEQVMFPSRTGMWLKRCCRLTTGRWHVAHSSISLDALICDGPFDAWML